MMHQDSLEPAAIRFTLKCGLQESARRSGYFLSAFFMLSQHNTLAYYAFYYAGIFDAGLSTTNYQDRAINVTRDNQNLNYYWSNLLDQSEKIIGTFTIIYLLPVLNILTTH